MRNATIPEMIRLARTASGLTQKEVGIGLGYPAKDAQSIIANWEGGHRPVPRDKIRPLAKMLKLNPSDLLP